MPGEIGSSNGNRLGIRSRAILSKLLGMAPSPKRRPVHFLHIGKTAGTHLKAMLERINEAQQDIEFVGHGHKVHLKDLPPGEDYFFAIRDPIARFVSGFYSRKREGGPATISRGPFMRGRPSQISNMPAILPKRFSNPACAECRP